MHIHAYKQHIDYIGHAWGKWPYSKAAPAWWTGGRGAVPAVRASAPGSSPSPLALRHVADTRNIVEYIPRSSLPAIFEG